MILEFELSFQDISNAINSENIDITGGTIRSKDENFKIGSNNKKYTANEISEIVIK